MWIVLVLAAFTLYSLYAALEEHRAPEPYDVIGRWCLMFWQSFGLFKEPE